MKIKLSPNFTVQECQHSDYARENGIDNVLPIEYYKNAIDIAEKILEPIRKQFGAFSPLSWYRSPEVNAAVGGSKTSDHMLGAAVDISIKGIDNMILAHWIAGSLKFKQVILEKGWVHCSFLAGENRCEVLHKTEDGYGMGLM